MATFKRRVAYLESTGTQYIDTGVTVDGTSEATVTVQLPTQSTSQQGIFGCRGQTTFALFSGNRVDSLQADYGSSGNLALWTTPIQGLDLTQFNTFTVSNYLAINGSVVKTVDPTTVNITTHLSLFCVTSASGPMTGYMMVGKMSRMQLKTGGTLVRNFIPALDTDNVPCMYDTVSKTCFYNQGTGMFKYAEMPGTAPFDRLEYLESTGTQWIDTKWYLEDSTSTFDIDTKFQFITSITYSCICGTLSSYNDKEIYYFIQQYGSSIEKLMFHNGDSTTAAGTLLLSFPCICKMHWNGQDTTSIYVNQDEYSISDTIDNRGTNTLYIFASNKNGTVSARSASRIYYFSIKVNNTLVRNFIPVLWHANVPYTDGNTGSSVTPTTDTPGMYDTVSKRLFVNQGTGQFLYSLAPTYSTYIPHPMDKTGATFETNPPIDGSKGVFIKSGSELVSARMTMVGATVSSGQNQLVYSGGIASDVSIVSGGIALVSSGGFVETVSISSGGAVSLLSGASGANLSVDMVTVDPHLNNINISAGASADSIYNHNGFAIIHGSATNVICDGGYTYTYSTCVISGISCVAGTNDLRGSVTDLDVLGNNVRIYEGQYSSVVIHSGATPQFRNGTGEDAQVLQGGTLVVGYAGYSGAIFSDVTVSSGGHLTVSSGGTANNVNTIDYGAATVVSGGVLSGASILFTKDNGGNNFGMEVSRGGSVADIYVSGINSRILGVRVSGDISSAIIDTGGRLDIYNTASDVTLVGGGMQLYGSCESCVLSAGYINGGTTAVLTSVVASAGTLNLASGGVISGLVLDGSSVAPQLQGICSDVQINAIYSTWGYGLAHMYNVVIAPGMRANLGYNAHNGYGIEVNSGAWLTVYSGGQGSGVTVLSGGTAQTGLGGGVQSGALLSDVTVMSGGTLVVGSDCSALAVTSNPGAVIIVSDGGYIEYTNVGPVYGETGVWLKNRYTSEVISSGMSMDTLDVASGQALEVYNSGYVDSVLMPSAGVANPVIHEGGTINYLSLSGGYISAIFESGGTVNSLYIESCSNPLVSGPGSIGELTLDHLSSGVLYLRGDVHISEFIQLHGAARVYDANVVTANAAGIVYAHESCLIGTVTVSSGGSLVASSGASVSLADPKEGARLMSSNGAYVGVHGAVWFDSGYTVVSSAQQIPSVALGSKHNLWVCAFGSVGTATVGSSATVSVYSGGSVLSATITGNTSSGTFIIDSGGRIESMYISGARNAAIVGNGTIGELITYSTNQLPVTGTVIEYLSQNTMGGVHLRSSGVISSGDIRGNHLHVSNGIISAVTVYNGGHMSVYAGGTALGVLVSSGGDVVNAGGYIEYVTS